MNSVCVCVCVSMHVCTSSPVGLLDRIGEMNRALVLRTSRKELDRGERSEELTMGDGKTSA